MRFWVDDIINTSFYRFCFGYIIILCNVSLSNGVGLRNFSFRTAFFWTTDNAMASHKVSQCDLNFATSSTQGSLCCSFIQDLVLDYTTCKLDSCLYLKSLFNSAGNESTAASDVVLSSDNNPPASSSQGTNCCSIFAGRVLRFH